MTVSPVKTGPAEGNALPLSGIRILDLTMVWAGPYATRLLADLGAEVIKVEGPGRTDLIRVTSIPDPKVERPWNDSRFFNENNRNKLGMAIDPRRDAGKKILFDLALKSDIVIENFRPGVINRMGLPWEKIHAANPRVSLVSMPAYSSHKGEDKLPGYGPNVEEMSGITHFTGYLDGEPHKLGISYGDPVAGLGAAGAVLLAILQRERTGKGMRMEVSQRNMLVNLIGEAIVATQLGKEPQRIGNRHPVHAPQGVYPTADGRWLALTIASDQQWSAFAKTIGAAGSGLDNAAARRVAHDALDQQIAAWSAGLGIAEAVDLLRKIGVAASIVADASDMVADPSLVDRGFLVDVPHESLGISRMPAPLWRFEETQREVHRAPFLGEHNERILSELLGYSATEIEELKAEGIIGDAPAGVGA